MNVLKIWATFYSIIRSHWLGENERGWNNEENLCEREKESECLRNRERKKRERKWVSEKEREREWSIKDEKWRRWKMLKTSFHRLLSIAHPSHEKWKWKLLIFSLIIEGYNGFLSLQPTVPKTELVQSQVIHASTKSLFCGQFYKHFMSVNCDPRVVIWAFF